MNKSSSITMLAILIGLTTMTALAQMPSETQTGFNSPESKPVHIVLGFIDGPNVICRETGPFGGLYRVELNWEGNVFVAKVGLGGEDETRCQSIARETLALSREQGSLTGNQETATTITDFPPKQICTKSSWYGRECYWTEGYRVQKTTSRILIEDRWEFVFETSKRR